MPSCYGPPGAGPPGARELRVSHGEVRFERIRFGYGTERGVLRGIDVTIAPGERVGLVGASGAGKSTLVHLLLHFYEPEQGRILIDRQDVATITQESLRAAIAMVTQDTSLLHRSIRDNIRYGRPRASNPEVEAAARRAHANDFICELQDWHGRRGYDAHVGERGVSFRAASDNASPSPASFSRTPPFSCWTKPPPRSTQKSKRQNSGTA